MEKDEFLVEYEKIDWVVVDEQRKRESGIINHKATSIDWIPLITDQQLNFKVDKIQINYQVNYI